MPTKTTQHTIQLTQDEVTEAITRYLAKEKIVKGDAVTSVMLIMDKDVITAIVEATE